MASATPSNVMLRHTRTHTFQGAAAMKLQSNRLFASMLTQKTPKSMLFTVTETREGWYQSKHFFNLNT